MDILRRGCFFNYMSTACHSYVMGCDFCKASYHGEHVSGEVLEQSVIPDRRWQYVFVDVLAISGSSEGIGLLVVFDPLTKWVEVRVLQSHRATEVASKFLDICYQWGPPEYVRSDGETDVFNAIMKSVYEAFGITLLRDAPRQPAVTGKRGAVQ